MDFKTIFTEGKKEWKRRRSISQDNSALKDQLTLLSSRRTQLGQKAWNEKLDLSGFPDINEVLIQNQEQLDKFADLLETCQKKRQEQEELKASENEKFSKEKSKVEDEKKGVDSRLSQEKDLLKTHQKDLSQAESRTGQISKEREQLQKKITDVATTSEDRAGHENRLTQLAAEEAELLEKRRTLNESIKTQTDKVTPLQGESDDLQKKIHDIQNRQKEAIGAIDDTLTSVRKEAETHTSKTKEIEKLQQQQFTLLGEKLAASDAQDAAIGAEMGAIRETEAAISRINQNIAALDSQQNELSSKAYTQMLTIIIGGSLLIIAIIVAAVILLKPKQQNPLEKILQGKVPVEALGEIIAKTQTDEPEDLKKSVEAFSKGMGTLKAASEQKIGEGTPVAGEADLKPVLPEVSGWEMTPPIYSKINISGVESSSLRNTYHRGEDQEISVEITDTHSVSVLLAPSQALFMMNMAVDDEQMYQKTGKIGDIPMIESLEKETLTARLVLVVKERYLINLETRSDNGLDTLKEFAGHLNLSQLE